MASSGIGMMTLASTCRLVALMGFVLGADSARGSVSFRGCVAGREDGVGGGVAMLAAVVTATAEGDG